MSHGQIAMAMWCCSSHADFSQAVPAVWPLPVSGLAPALAVLSGPLLELVLAVWLLTALGQSRWHGLVAAEILAEPCADLAVQGWPGWCHSRAQPGPARTELGQPVTCSKAGNQELPSCLPILKCVFIEAKPLLSGLTRHQP